MGACLNICSSKFENAVFPFDTMMCLGLDYIVRREDVPTLPLRTKVTDF